MMNLLAGLVTWAFSGALASILVGGGLTLVIAVGLDAAVTNFLESATGWMGNLPADVLQFSLLTGWADALSIVGGAFLARVGLVAASNILGVKRA